MNRSSKQPEYSDKYFDAEYEYRHVILTREMHERVKDRQKTDLLSEQQWRDLGVVQSRGWQHYDNHMSEPYILLFRRPIGTNPQTGLVEKGLRQ